MSGRPEAELAGDTPRAGPAPRNRRRDRRPAVLPLYKGRPRNGRCPAARTTSTASTWTPAGRPARWRTVPPARCARLTPPSTSGLRPGAPPGVGARRTEPREGGGTDDNESEPSGGQGNNAGGHTHASACLLATRDAASLTPASATHRQAVVKFHGSESPSNRSCDGCEPNRPSSRTA